MDKKEIQSIWDAFLEVQEAKKKLDPVGKEDGDIDNDGDEDSSDEYLKNRRKKIGKEIEKDKDVKESEESPYPSLDKKKREKKGSNLEDAGGPAAKLKGESVEEAKKIDCPKCDGKGCDHCDDKGYHMKEDYEYFIESLTDEELDEYIDWLNEDIDEGVLSTIGGAVVAKKAIGAAAAGVGAAANAAAKHIHKKKMKNDPGYAAKHRVNQAMAMAKKKRANEEVELDELSKKTYGSYIKKASQSAADHGMQAGRKQAERDEVDRSTNRHGNVDKDAVHKAMKTTPSDVQKPEKKAAKRLKGINTATKRLTGESTNMDRYVDALRSISNDQLDELSTKTLQSYSKKAERDIDKQYAKGNSAEKRGDHKAAARADHKAEKRYDGIDRADAKIAKKKKSANSMGGGGSVSSGGMYGQKRTAAGHSYRESAYDIIDAVLEMRQLARLESVLSGHELAAIEEKMKQPNDTGTAPEGMYDKESPKSKKFVKDHEAGSDKSLEDMEAQSEMDGSAAGKAVKSQSPTRRGEKRIGDTAMPKPKVHPGQMGSDLKAGH